MTISASGAFSTTANPFNGTTLTVTTPIIGNIRVVTTETAGLTSSITGISGGGVSTWTRIVGPTAEGSDGRCELWWGKVTSSTGTTLTFTWSGSTTANEYTDQQFSTTASSPVWSVDVSSTATGSGATVSYPSLTPTGSTGELYRGYAFVSGTGAAGATGGYTYNLTNANNVACYNTNVTATTAPTASQSGTITGWATLAAIFSDGTGSTATITEDASTPAEVTGTGIGSVVTASFTPPANSLVLAIAGCLGSTGTGTTTATVTSSDAASWTVGASLNSANVTGTDFGGSAVLAYHYYTTSPGAITVTNTIGGTNAKGKFLRVVVLDGAAATQTGAATASKTVTAGSTTAFQQSITPTTAQSLIYGIACDSDGIPTLTAAANSTLSGTEFTDTTDIPNTGGISAAAFRSTSATPSTPAAITLGLTSSSTATGGPMAMLEILPGTNISVNGADTGSGADSASIVPSDNDQLHLTDSYSKLFIKGLETSTGADTAFVSTAPIDADAGSGADAATLAATVIQDDPSQIRDNAVAAVLLPVVTDAGTGTDTAAAAVVTVITATDAGSGSENANAAPNGVETASGADTATIAATVVASDAATSVEAGDHSILIDPLGERTVRVNAYPRKQIILEDNGGPI